MNPFKPIFVTLGLCVVINHLLGYYIYEAATLATAFLFFTQYLVWNDLKKAEPDWLKGETTRMVFGHPKVAMVIAYVLGLFVLVITLIETYGIVNKFIH